MTLVLPPNAINIRINLPTVIDVDTFLANLLADNFSGTVDLRGCGNASDFISAISLENNGATVLLDGVNSIDSDAQTIINNVHTADGQLSEYIFQSALNEFVVGCKADDNYSKMTFWRIRGPRTLAGFFASGVGGSITNVGFGAGDYNRLYLAGDGSAYLRTGVFGDDFAQNNLTLAWYSIEYTDANLPGPGQPGTLVGNGGTGNGSSQISISASQHPKYGYRHQSSTFTTTVIDAVNNRLYGVARNSGTQVHVRRGNAIVTENLTSQTPDSSEFWMFERPSVSFNGGARCEFVLVGKFLDLTLLENRVQAFMDDTAGLS
jgi:hypothetical protein